MPPSSRFTGGHLTKHSLPSSEMHVPNTALKVSLLSIMLAVDDVVWVGEGAAGVNGAGELHEHEATGAAGESVLGLADVGHLSVAAEVAADVGVTGARGDAGDKKPAINLEQLHHARRRLRGGAFACQLVHCKQNRRGDRCQNPQITLGTIIPESYLAVY